MASPCPPVPVATPPLRSPNQSPIGLSHTPPPRPPSAPSVYAPRPVRVQAYRPAFSRPFFVSEGNTAQVSQSQQRTSSPLSLGLGVRRSSSASISSLTFISNASDSETAGTGSAAATAATATAPTSVPHPPSSTTPGASEAVDPSRVQIYSPTKDALEELYKIMRRSASSTSPPVSGAALAGKGFVGLPTRSPGFRYGHRRDASDASDSGISGALSNLYLSSRLSPDGGEFRPSLSPVARNLVRNPMVRDPSFNREPSPNPASAAEDGLRHPTAVNPIVTVNLGDDCVTADALADDIPVSTAAPATVGEVVPPTPIDSKAAATPADETPAADDKKE